MRAKWRRGVTIFGALCGLVLSTGHVSANGWGWTRTTYVVAPASYVEVLPSSYVLPTSYVLSSSYAYAPTVYATSYAVPVTRRYVERPLVATSYYAPAMSFYPTSYYASPLIYPTVYEPTVVAYAANPCCVSVPAPAKGGTSAATAPAKPMPSTVVSKPAEPEMSAANAEGAGEEPTTRRDTAAPANPVDAAEASPPAAPAPEKGTDGANPTGTPLTPNPALIPSSTPTPALLPAPPADVTSEVKKDATTKDQPRSQPVKVNPPQAPTDEAPVFPPLPEDAGTTKRQALKPAFDATKQPYRRSGRALNVLEGKVVSVDSGQPEEGVRITISSKAEAGTDREAMTNAFGHYAVRLPDGDWTVKVADQKGRIHSVRNLIVSRGQIVDDLGQSIPTLTITR